MWRKGAERERERERERRGKGRRKSACALKVKRNNICSEVTYTRANTNGHHSSLKTPPWRIGEKEKAMEIDRLHEDEVLSLSWIRLTRGTGISLVWLRELT